MCNTGTLCSGSVLNILIQLVLTLDCNTVLFNDQWEREAYFFETKFKGE